VKVGIVMGSSSDAEIMDGAVQALREFDIEVEVRVLSAHRTPLDTLEYARTAKERGISVLIAGAGGAAHLAGVIAAATALPVIGVPIALQNLQGLDSLLSMVQMPRGVPVAVVAINGSRNAGLLAVRIMAVADDKLSERYKSFHEEMASQVRTQDKALQDRYDGGEGSS
jgi:5-(carboxyamino)imidazole ribonucleotide mutase